MFKNYITFRVILSLFLIISASALTRAQGADIKLITKTTRPSLSGFGISGASSVSADGRYVLFMSGIPNLVSNDTQSTSLDLFLRDLQGNKTTLISVSTNGVGGGEADSLTGQISTNGQLVVFESKASNLATNDSNDTYDVFVRNLASGTTELINRNSSGAAAARGATTPLMSDDGRMVVFQSDDRELGTLGIHEISNIWAKDLTTGALQRVNVDLNLAANATNMVSINASISSSGRYVAFEISYRRGNEFHGDVFVRDLQEQTTTLISSDKANLYRNRTGRTDIAQAFHPLLTSNGEQVFWKIKGSATQIALIMRSAVEGGGTSLIGTNDSTGMDFELSIDAEGKFAVFPKGKDVLLWTEESGATNIVNRVADGTAVSTGAAASPILSADGNWIAFLSDADDLVTNEVSGEFQWFLKNRVTGKTTLLSKNADDEGSGGVDISSISMSSDGSVIVFDSESAEQVEDDLNRALDVFVTGGGRDGIELVNELDPNLPNLTAFGASQVVAVTPNSRFILFTSRADYLTENDFNAAQDVFLHDTISGETRLVSVSSDGLTSGDANSSSPAMSDDGRYIAFTSLASNLTAGDNNVFEDIFLRDMQTGTTTLISVTADGTGSGNQRSHLPQISADGSIIVWESTASNLLPIDTNPGNDIYLRDVKANVTYLISMRFAGPPTAAKGESNLPVLSRDGKWVSFASRATDILEGGNSSGIRFIRAVPNGPSRALFASTKNWFVPAYFTPDNRFIVAAQNPTPNKNVYSRYDVNTLASELICEFCDSLAFDATAETVGFRQKLPQAPQPQVVVLDWATKATNVITFNASASAYANDASSALSISADGNRIVFKSRATNLVASDTNSAADLYLWDRTQNKLNVLTQSSESIVPQAFVGKPLITPNRNEIIFHSLAENLVAGDYNLDLDIFRLSLDAATASIHLTATRVGADQLQLEWPTEANRAYQVQFKEDLRAASWTSIGGEIAGNGGTRTLTTAIGGASNRFYRVQEINR